MLSTNCTVSYEKKIDLLVFEYGTLSDNYNQAFDRLFRGFSSSLFKIILESHVFPIMNSTGYNRGGFFYEKNITCNEHMTDIIFLHGKYLDYTSHYPDFLRQEQFSCWQNIIRDVDKSAVLKVLYQDNKISRAYLFKYAYSHPASLYELGKYNLFINKVFGEEEAAQAEKIDKLPLPNTIKEDLKLSFSR